MTGEAQVIGISEPVLACLLSKLCSNVWDAGIRGRSQGPLRSPLILGKYESIAPLPKMRPNVYKCLWFLIFVSGQHSFYV